MLLALAALFTGCVHTPPPPADPAVQTSQTRARQLLRTLAERNPELDTFKGVGRIRWQRGRESLTARMAWVGAAGGRLRVEWFSIAGQTLVRLVDDGEKLAIRSRQPERYFKARSKGFNLEKILSVPVGTDDIFAVLAGRLRIHDFHHARWLSSQGGDSADALLLLRRYGRRVQKIYIDADHRRLLGWDLFGADGSVCLRVRIAADQTVETFQLPRCLTISGRQNHRLELTVDRHWVNIPLETGVFSLPESE